MSTKKWTKLIFVSRYRQTPNQPIKVKPTQTREHYTLLHAGFLKLAIFGNRNKANALI